MTRRLTLPKDTNTPSDLVLGLLDKYEIGQVLDSGDITSEWSSGHAVLTDLGIALCSPHEGDAVGVAWHEIESLPIHPRTHTGTTPITFPIDGGSITFDIDTRLLANIKSAYSQLRLPEPIGSPVEPPVRSTRASLETTPTRPTFAASVGAKPIVPYVTPEATTTRHKKPLHRRIWRRIAK